MEIDHGYRCSDTLVFSGINPDAAIIEPVSGTIELRLSEDIPHPVEVGIKDLEGDDDAEYAEFSRRTVTVDNPDGYPVLFRFNTGSATNRGAKWYYYQTAEWNSESNLTLEENPEFVRHHIAIPPAQIIRLCHRILSENAGETTIDELIAYYDNNPQRVFWDFSRHIKRYVGFDSRMEIIDFLVGQMNVRRSHSDMVNTVAKYIVREENRRLMNSEEDIEKLAEVVNSQNNLPDIETKEVVKEVVNRVESESELKEIADDIGVEDWSRLLY